MIKDSEIWFILLKISNLKKIQLIEKYKDEDIIKENRNIIKELNNIDKEVNKEEIDKFKNYLIKEKIGYITYNSKYYLEKLKQLEEPPYILFYKGNIELLKENLIAVVGARKCSVYGANIAKEISRNLAYNNFTVVSGLATGIDSISHKSAVDNKGKTIGVLGCGIDIVYPKSNKILYEEIINSGGLIISEFLPKTPPFSYNFPKRNRIISAISDKLIIVEATVKSGSLITVNYALSLGMDIMAIPGSVLNGNSKGCNELIRDGAQVYSGIEDLYLFLKINKKDKRKIEENSYKIKLLKIIDKEPIHLDDIINSVNVDRKVLFELLFEMQNRNEIICLPGNYYAKTI